MVPALEPLWSLHVQKYLFFQLSQMIFNFFSVLVFLKFFFNLDFLSVTIPRI